MKVSSYQNTNQPSGYYPKWALKQNMSLFNVMNFVGGRGTVGSSCKCINSCRKRKDDLYMYKQLMGYDIIFLYD